MRYKSLMKGFDNALRKLAPDQLSLQQYSFLGAVENVYVVSKNDSFIHEIDL